MTLVTYTTNLLESIALDCALTN